jgi:hypothetical protein
MEGHGRAWAGRAAPPVLSAVLAVYPAYFGLVAMLDAWVGGSHVEAQIRLESGRAFALDVVRTAGAGLWIVLPVTIANALVALGRGARGPLRGLAARLLAGPAILGAALALAGLSPASCLVPALALAVSGAATALADRMRHHVDV